MMANGVAIRGAIAREDALKNLFKINNSKQVCVLNQFHELSMSFMSRKTVSSANGRETICTESGRPSEPLIWSAMALSMLSAWICSYWLGSALCAHRRNWEHASRIVHEVQRYCTRP